MKGDDDKEYSLVDETGLESDLNDKIREAVSPENQEKLRSSTNGMIKGDDVKEDSNEDQYAMLKKLYDQKNEAYK